MFRCKMEPVEAWMRMQNLPRNIRRKVAYYYSDVWVRLQGAQDSWHRLMSEHDQVLLRYLEHNNMPCGRVRQVGIL